MKTLFVCASVLTLVTASLPAHANPGFVTYDPYFAGAPEEEQGKQEEQGKEEEKNQEENKQEENKQEENKQEEQGQEEQGRGQRGGSVGSDESSIEAQRWGRGRFVCYSRNLRGRTFQAQGFERFNTQRRAIQNCRARSGFILGRTCANAGCRRF